MTIMDYRTQDGLAYYGFSIEFRPGVGWRVYIIFAPFQQDGEDSMTLPYQSIDGDGRLYVDCSSKLDSLGDARSVAALWAELAQRYQRTREQRAFYMDLIRLHQRTQAQRKFAPAGSDHLGDTIGTGGSGAGPEDGGPVIPHPRATLNSFRSRQETDPSGRVTGEVA